MACTLWKGETYLRISLGSCCALVPRAGKHAPCERTPRNAANTKVLHRKKRERILIIEPSRGHLKEGEHFSFFFSVE